MSLSLATVFTCVQLPPNWLHIPKCYWIVQKNFGLASENIASLQIAPNWFSLCWFDRKCRGPFGNITNEVEITKKYRKFNNRSFRGKRGQGLHELIPQLRTQKYILEADLISIFLVHVPKDNFTLEIRNHSRDRNVLVTCLLKVSLENKQKQPPTYRERS